MPAVYDWNDPFLLTTPQGTLALNQLVTVAAVPLGYYMLDGLSCSSGAEMRVSRDDMPQASGEIKHLHYKSGYEMRLKVELWQTIGDNGLPAMHATLVQMLDLLQLHLNSIIGEDPLLQADGRIQWTPQGALVDRMLNPIRLLERPILSNDGALSAVTFAVHTDRPYAMDAPQVLSNIPGAGTIVLTNAGTAPFLPVAQVKGPFNTFTFRNNTVLDPNGQPLALVYDASLPGAQSVGAGHYVEIDFWRNTLYLDGHFANLKPGLNIPSSDFWSIEPGANSIQITGGYTGTGVDILWQNSYA